MRLLRVSLIGLLFALFPVAKGATPPQSAVARVNQTVITAAQLDEELERRLPANGAHGKMVDPRQKEQLRKQALEELIARELAYQRSKAIGLKVPAAEVEASAGRIRGRYKTAASFREALKAEQIDEAEFRRRVERDLLLKKIYRQEIEDKSLVTTAEALAFYNANKAQYKMPEAVRLLSIGVKSAPGKEAAAKKKIEEAQRKLKSGAAFAEVAYTYSEDDYRMVGGDYGLVHRGQLSPDVEAAVFRAKTGELTGPLRSGALWLLFRVESHSQERQLPFNEVQEKIATRLKDRKIRDKRAEFARGLRAGAVVEYLKP